MRNRNAEEYERWNGVLSMKYIIPLSITTYYTCIKLEVYYTIRVLYHSAAIGVSSVQPE